MQDLSLRMSFYKKIATIRTDEDQENLINELNDRFGKIPPEVVSLMEISKLKWLCKKVGVERLEANLEGILISFKDNKFAAPEQLMQMIFSSKGKIKLHVGQKILHLKDVKSVAAKIKSAFEVITQLEAILKSHG